MRARVALWVFSLLVGAWLVAPTLVVIPLAFTGQKSLVFPPRSWSLRWFANFFADPTWVGSLLNSLQVAGMTAAVATVLGTLAALGLRSRFRGRSAAGALVLAPMLVPAVVFGVGVYAVFLELKLIGTFIGFVAAHTALALPFVVIPVTSSLAGFDETLERAASVCGANRISTFLRVTLPAIAPGVLSGFMFAFVVSFDEIVVSLFISSPYLQTLPVKIWGSLRADLSPVIAAASSLLVLLTLLLMIVTALLRRRFSK